jgi:class 3 adenylate cyclase/tetratricopeptide (TPR) repeat protein
MKIEQWLGELGLERYAEVFQENAIDAEVLPELDDQDLAAMGVLLGHRKKLLKAIAALPRDPDGSATESRHRSGPEVEPGGERRQVTVLFADLSGFTKLSSELDAEEVHTLLNRYFGLLDSIIEGFGGRVDKHIGDSVMAVFGAPVAHDNDPERAVRTAFEIHSAMPGLSSEVGRPLQTHIGIASGQVTGSDAHREYTVTGSSVNLASRLQDKAGAGETLITQAVHKEVAPLADCHSVGEIQAKGFDAPIEVWRLNRLRDETIWGEDASFVGRRNERRQFSALIDVCRESAAGQALLVRGEAGIGKSCLLREFAAIARRAGFATHKSLVLDFGVGKDQDAIRTLVRSLLDLPLTSDEPARRKASKAALSRGWLEADDQIFLDDILGLPHPLERRGLYDAMDNATRLRGKRDVVVKMLAAASREQPRFLIIEDVHWADQIVLSHLANLCATVQGCAAILAMTTRPVSEVSDYDWRTTISSGSLMTIDLGPLQPDEAAALAGEFVMSSGGVAQRCLERAEGNPLFLVQLLHNAEDGSEEEVPSSIQSLVLARTDHLRPEDKEALQAASVIGQRFTMEELWAVLGVSSYDCTPLIEQHFIGREGEAYLFVHALVRDGVYESLLRSRARELHLRAADHYGATEPVLRATHLDRAESPEAPLAYLEAARGQLESFRFEQAQTLTRRGLELAKDRSDRWRLQQLLSQLLLDQGAIDEATRAFRETLELSESTRERTESLLGLVACMRLTDDYDAALSKLDEAEALAKADADPAVFARIHSLRGNLYFPLGRIEDCAREHDAAIAFARQAESADDEAQALSGLADASYARGRMKTAFEYFSDCVTLSRKLGLGRIEVANRSMVGFSRLYLCQFDEALVDSRATIEAAAKVGQLRAELLGHVLAYHVYFDTAQYDEIAPHVERGRELTKELGAGRFEVQNMMIEGIVAALKDDKARAREVLRASLELSRQTSVAFTGPRVLGYLAIVTDDPAERRVALAEGEEILKRGAVSHNHLFFYRFAMQTALDKSEWDEAERYAALLEAYTAAEPLPWSDFFIAQNRALIALKRDGHSPEVTAALSNLRAQAQAWGLASALPALDAALEGAEPRRSERA